MPNTNHKGIFCQVNKPFTSHKDTSHKNPILVVSVVTAYSCSYTYNYSKEYSK